MEEGMAKDKEVAECNGGEVSPYNEKNFIQMDGVQYKVEDRTIHEPSKITVEHIETQTIVKGKSSSKKR